MRFALVADRLEAPHGAAVAARGLAGALARLTDLIVVSYDRSSHGAESVFPPWPRIGCGRHLRQVARAAIRGKGAARLGFGPSGQFKGLLVNGAASLPIAEPLLGRTEYPVYLSHEPVEQLLALASDRQVTFDRFRMFAFVSAAACRQWQLRSPLGDRPSILLPNCADERRVAEVVRRKSTCSAGRLRLAVIGTLMPRKNQEILPPALAQALSAGVDAEILMIGADPQGYGVRVRAAAEAAGVRDRVHFLGAGTDTIEQLGTCDALLLPSLAEGLPLVVLEALALGVPVVAAPVDGVPEAVIDGETGIFARTSAEFAEAIERLARDPGLGHRLAAAGLRHYREHFSEARRHESLRSMLARIEEAQ